MTPEELFNTPHARANAEKNKKKALITAATVKPTEEILAVINGLELFTEESIAILTQRGQGWHDIWPIGEPHYSRDDGYQFVLHSNQVAAILQVSIRTAQELLQKTRAFVGKKDDSYVSVPSIEILEVELGASGEATTRAKSVSGIIAYVHQYAKELPSINTEWMGTGSSQSSHTFEGLGSDKRYWFRVVAIGTNGKRSYSPVVSKVIQ